MYVDYDRVVARGSRACRDTNEFEHYRLDRDPHERHNLWPPKDPADEALQADLRAQLDAMRDCAGNTHLSPALEPDGPSAILSS